MKTIQIPDEYDMRAEVNNVLSCAYEGDEWMEDGSVRQDIRNLQRLTDNHISVLANHDNKLQAIATSLNTINKMLEILSKRVGLDDESE